MSLKVSIVLAGFLFAALQAPARADVVADTQLQSCYDEARWPVLVQPGYVYGGARVREQKRNGFNRAVFTMRMLCYRMANPTADKAGLAGDCGGRIEDMLKVYGVKARDHARRTRDICQAMTGRTITVEGI